MSFTHLHVHTEFSLLDGACRIERLMEKAESLGMKSVAITDHGVMYGAVDFYKAAKKHGIKPIIGCEVYVARRTRFDRVSDIDRSSCHLVLLCKNETGYRNLTHMVSKSFTEGFYNNPRVDLDLLKEHSEGLIALSACLAGEIPRSLLANDYASAKKAALRYEEIFGKGNFYLELQDHGLREQSIVNSGIIRLSEETGIPLVCTNDCHYIDREDERMHHILVCIQTNRTVNDEDTLNFGSDEFYFKSEEEMRRLFPKHPEAFDNTEIIAEACNMEFEFGKTKLPRFDTPDGSDNKDYFVKMCFEGLKRHYGENPDSKIIDRLNYEINTISSMGYVNYYLIVHDFIRYAKSVGIPVGPGRGSGVGSLAAYCIGITNVDPLKYDLIFERFLNPERVSMPDFDIDFSDERRQEIIDYVIRKYGADHVAQIVTFGTMAARLAVRDVGRAMAVPYSICDTIAKLIPMELKMTIKTALNTVPELKEHYERDSEIKDLLDMAMKVEGMPRHTSTHAAGVVITDRPVEDYVPLATNDNVPVTQYTMTAIEELGLLKMDFLGLRNLSIIDNAVKYIHESNLQFNIDLIPPDDKNVFKEMSDGNCLGVFQFESAGMRRTTMRAKPESIEDLTAIVSLYRPGPMQFIDQYVENRQNPEKITYRHERLRKILDVTYGCIIYQEQVMTIFRELAGYSLGRADIVRRAMAKKKYDVLKKEKDIFINGELDADGNVIVEGCLRRGVSKDVAEVLFKEIENFASYAFNKSHAAAYSVLAYQTAYLKYYYPVEYMSSLLSSVLGSFTKLQEYMEECARLGIKVLPPHVNYSGMTFSGENGNIRYGMLAIKSLGRNVISAIVSNREMNGKFTGFYDFCQRVNGRDVNRRAIEALIMAGALDNLGNNRREMMTALPQIMDSLESDRRNNIDGQLGLFGSDEFVLDLSMMRDEDYSVKEKLQMEKEVTGMYISGHPMAEFKEAYNNGTAARTDYIIASAKGESSLYKDEEKVMILGITTEIKKKITKNNSAMAFLTVEDMYGSIECLVFPTIYSYFSPLIKDGEILSLEGRLSFTEEKEPKLIVDVLKPVKSLDDIKMNPQNKTSETAQKPKAVKNPGLYIKVPSEGSPLYKKAMQYIDIFDGNVCLYIYFEDTKKLVRAPRQNYVAPNDVLLRELNKLLGDNNAVLKI